MKLKKLQKKYGHSSQEILEYFSKIEAEILTLENSDQRIIELRKQIEKQKQIWKDLIKKDMEQDNKNEEKQESKTQSVSEM